MVPLALWLLPIGFLSTPGTGGSITDRSSLIYRTCTRCKGLGRRMSLPLLLEGAESLTPQGRTPLRGSQLSASRSRLTADSHSTDDEGTDVDVVREEPVFESRSEGTVYAVVPRD